MPSNYNGVDSFSPNLQLCTDGDQPHAALFRLPDERLLDNDVHVRNKALALETRATALEVINAGPRLTSVEGRATTLERGVALERGRQLEVWDEFTEILDNHGDPTPHVHGDTPWRAMFSVSADVFYGGGVSTAASSLRISRVANAMSGGVYKTNVRALHSNWRGRFLASVDTLTTDFEIGFSDNTSSVPGTASASAWTAYFDPGTSANWLLRTRNSSTGLTSTANTGVAVVANTTYRLELGRNGSNYTLSVNGGAAVNAGANVPAVTDFGNPIIRMSGSTVNDACRVDLFHAYSVLARW